MNDPADLIPKGATSQQLMELGVTFCKSFEERERARGMAGLPSMDRITDAYYYSEPFASCPGDPTPREPLDTSKYYSAYPHPATINPSQISVDRQRSAAISRHGWPKHRTPIDSGPVRNRLYFLTFEGFRYAVIEQNEDDAVSIVKEAANARMTCPECHHSAHLPSLCMHTQIMYDLARVCMCYGLP